MAIAWLILTVWLLVQMMAFGNGDLDRRMELLAQALAEAASAARDDPVELKRRLATTEHIFVAGVISELESARPYVPVYRLWTKDGRLLTSSAGATPMATTQAPLGFSQLRSEGHAYRLVGAMSSDGAVRAGVAERLDERLSANWPFLEVIGGSQLVILAWIVAVTAVAARRGFAPLRNLSLAIAARPAGDLSPLTSGTLFAEIAPIVDEINGLLERESRRLEVERGFLADAAHELRTPLAAIGIQAHLFVNTADEGVRRVAYVELQQGIDRVSHLMSQLLTMASLDAASPSTQRESTDIAELCRQRLAALARLARQRDVSLDLDAPDTLVALVDRSAFASVVDNLVDNAIRHRSSGGRVGVRLAAHDDGFDLSVRDDGRGIDEADRERVFERFVRLPGAHGVGSGLGLAIVRQVLQTQGGTIRFIEGLSGRGVGLQATYPSL